MAIGGDVLEVRCATLCHPGGAEWKKSTLRARPGVFFWAGTFLLREGGEVSGFDFEWVFLVDSFFGGWVGGEKRNGKFGVAKFLTKLAAKGFLSATSATERTMEKVVQNLGATLSN